MARYRFMVLVSVFTALVLVASLGSAQENEVYTDVGGWVIPRDVLQIIMNDTAIPPGFPSLQAHRDFARQFYVCDNNFTFDMVGLYVYMREDGYYSNITQNGGYALDYVGVYDPLAGQIVLIFMNNTFMRQNTGDSFDFTANSSFRLWFIVLDEGSFNKGFLVLKAFYRVWNSTTFAGWGDGTYPNMVSCHLSSNFSLASVMRGNVTPATITETRTETRTTTATATVTETRVETSTLTTTKTATVTETSTLTVSETYTTRVATTATETTTITSPTTRTATTTLSYTTTVRELDETAVAAVGVGGLVLGIVASALLTRRR